MLYSLYSIKSLLLSEYQAETSHGNINCTKMLIEYKHVWFYIINSQY